MDTTVLPVNLPVNPAGRGVETVLDLARRLADAVVGRSGFGA